MRKFLFFIILIAVVAIGYSIFSDSDRREKAFKAIEGSTGVDLGGDPEKIIGDVGDMFKDLGDTITSPKFRRSVRRWGKDALDKLDDVQLENLKEDLQREAAGGNEDFDKVFEEYLGKSDSS